MLPFIVITIINLVKPVRTWKVVTLVGWSDEAIWEGCCGLWYMKLLNSLRKYQLHPPICNVLCGLENRCGLRCRVERTRALVTFYTPVSPITEHVYPVQHQQLFLLLSTNLKIDTIFYSTWFDERRFWSIQITYSDSQQIYQQWKPIWDFVVIE